MSSFRNIVVAALVASPFISSMVNAQSANPNPNHDGQCRKMGTLYDNGKDLCETMWSGSFKYVDKTSPDYDKAYYMWWFTEENPNDQVTQKRITAGLHPENYRDTSQCYLNYLGDKATAGPEPKSFTECFPWQGNACCAESTVENVTVMLESYGDEWRWDRCGTLSQACERFFVQEACLYECDTNAGLFRKFPPATYDKNNKTQNDWQIVNMPIRAEFCDAWYNACYDDYFCAQDSGDFFSCAKIPPVKGGAKPEEIAGIVILAIVAAFSTCFCCFMLKKERDGKPIFMKISAEDAEPIMDNGQTQQTKKSKGFFGGIFHKNHDVPTASA